MPGAGERTRTSDLLITNQLLYQLSYVGPGPPGGGRAVYRALPGGAIAGVAAGGPDGAD